MFQNYLKKLVMIDMGSRMDKISIILICKSNNNGVPITSTPIPTTD